MISVIIPALDEEGTIVALLRCLHGQRHPHEAIVADGGSRDRTREVATPLATVIHSDRGRAIQMNAGARRARGDILLFLHADCTLEDGALLDVERALARGTAVGGCFRQRIQADGILFRIIERCADLRAAFFPYFYGDSGIFIRRDLFFRLGGYPEIPIMEEVVLTRRMKRAGPIRILPKRIRVSPRRWERGGILRTTLRNWSITVRYHLGAAPSHLARVYPDVRDPAILAGDLHVHADPDRPA